MLETVKREGQHFPGVNEKLLLSVLVKSTVLYKINELALIREAYQALSFHNSFSMAFNLSYTLYLSKMEFAEPLLIMSLSCIKAGLSASGHLNQEKVEIMYKKFWSDILFDYKDDQRTVIATWNSERQPPVHDQHLDASIAALVILVSTWPKISKSELLLYLSFLPGRDSKELDENTKELTKLMVNLICSMREKSNADPTVALVMGCKEFLADSKDSELSTLLRQFLDKGFSLHQDKPSHLQGAIEALHLIQTKERSLQQILSKVQSEDLKHKNSVKICAGLLLGCRLMIDNVTIRLDNTTKHILVMHSLLWFGTNIATDAEVLVFSLQECIILGHHFQDMAKLLGITFICCRKHALFLPFVYHVVEPMLSKKPLRNQKTLIRLQAIKLPFFSSV